MASEELSARVGSAEETWKPLEEELHKNPSAFRHVLTQFIFREIAFGATPSETLKECDKIAKEWKDWRLQNKEIIHDIDPYVELRKNYERLLSAEKVDNRNDIVGEMLKSSETELNRVKSRIVDFDFPPSTARVKQPVLLATADIMVKRCASEREQLFTCHSINPSPHMCLLESLVGSMCNANVVFETNRFCHVELLDVVNCLQKNNLDLHRGCMEKHKRLMACAAVHEIDRAYNSYEKFHSQSQSQSQTQSSTGHPLGEEGIDGYKKLVHDDFFNDARLLKNSRKINSGIKAENVNVNETSIGERSRLPLASK